MEGVTVKTMEINILFYLLLLLPLLSVIFMYTRSPSNLPPGPFPWPVIGNIFNVGSKPHISLTHLATSYGPLISLRLGTQLVVVGSTPAVATEILKTHDSVVSARPAPHALQVGPDQIHLSLSFADRTDQWKYLRMLCKTELFSAQVIESQAKIREEKRLLNWWNSCTPRKELFMAGTDTSTSTIEWAMTELIKHPEVLKKVVTELAEKTSQGTLQESDLPRLPYLHSVVKETLRLHPPAPLLLPHRALETCKVMDYTIPKDTQVLVNLWAIGRDPTVWEDSLAFKPERFKESSIALSWSSFEFIPFGAGRRICPGLPMVAKQVPLILASLINYFNWSLPSDTHPEELDMAYKFGVTLAKEKPLLLLPTAKTL